MRWERGLYSICLLAEPFRGRSSQPYGQLFKCLNLPTEKHHFNVHTACQDRVHFGCWDNLGHGRVDDCKDRGNSLHQALKSESGCPATKHRKSYVNDDFLVITVFGTTIFCSCSSKRSYNSRLETSRARSSEGILENNSPVVRSMCMTYAPFSYHVLGSMMF